MATPHFRKYHGNCGHCLGVESHSCPTPYSEMLWVPIILSRAQRERRQSYMGLPRDQAVQRSGLGRGPALP